MSDSVKGSNSSENDSQWETWSFKTIFYPAKDLSWSNRNQNQIMELCNPRLWDRLFDLSCKSNLNDILDRCIIMDIWTSMVGCFGYLSENFMSHGIDSSEQVLTILWSNLLMIFSFKQVKYYKICTHISGMSAISVIFLALNSHSLDLCQSIVVLLSLKL